MCFWYQTGRPPGTGPVRVAATLAPVGIVRREDLRAAGVGDARDLQVVRIERLVAHERVGPAAEGPQHGGRDVARAGPHGDPQRHVRALWRSVGAVLPSAPQDRRRPRLRRRSRRRTRRSWPRRNPARCVNACAAMKSDMVNPMPDSAPAPRTWRQLYSAGLRARPAATASAQNSVMPSGLPITRPQAIAAISGPWPDSDIEAEHDARVRQREDRQDEVTRARGEPAQQAVGGRFDPVMDRVQRAQHGDRGPVAQHFVRVARLGGDQRVGLRHQRVQVGRRPRRDEEREDHARKRRVQARAVHAHPEHDAEQQVRRHAVDVRAVQQRERGDDGRGGGEVSGVDLGAVEERDDRDGADVVDDRRRGQEDAQLHRHARAHHGDQRDREGGVGRHRHAPAVGPRPVGNDERVQRGGHDHPAERGGDRHRRGLARSRGGPP